MDYLVQQRFDGLVGLTNVKTGDGGVIFALLLVLVARCKNFVDLRSLTPF
jgi:hypothetical protein